MNAHEVVIVAGVYARPPDHEACQVFHQRKIEMKKNQLSEDLIADLYS